MIVESRFLFYYEDMSIKEISKILSLPQGTVNSRLYRSREKLKKTLTSDGVGTLPYSGRLLMDVYKMFISKGEEIHEKV